MIRTQIESAANPPSSSTLVTPTSYRHASPKMWVCMLIMSRGSIDGLGNGGLVQGGLLWDGLFHIVARLAPDTAHRPYGAQATAAAPSDSFVGGRPGGLPWSQPL